MSLLLLVRHGQALPEAYAGQGHGGDAGLSPLGERQAAALGVSLHARGIIPDLVISGGLKRQVETAEISLRSMGVAEIAVKADLRWQEYDVEPIFAAYPTEPSGGSPESASANPRGFQRFLDLSLTRWMADPEPPEGLMPWAAFAAAAPTALAELAAATSSGKTVLVFTSAGPIAAVVADLLDLSPAAFLDVHRIVVNGSTTKIISGGRGRHLLTFNEHSYLETGTESRVTYR